MDRPRTLGELRATGYCPTSVKEEMRRNLVRKLLAREPLFPGILGYDDTVLPQLVNALLARHDLLVLGLRGQAKTRLLRQLASFLDEAIPIVAGSEINDDPLAPIGASSRARIAREGDDTPIEWVGRERRYQEKLATPDVTVADLFGEIDLIKHAEGRYLSDEATLHFGLVPRANRGIFCINELPDLAPKIQVALFNVLQERDLQVRGYAVRFPLDLCLVFSANPEDYTSRGRIVTPLKDRIGSVVRTHYPPTRELGIAITEANAWLRRDGTPVFVPHFMKEVLEETARRARTSPAVSAHSGVSVRLTIACMELLASNAERRALLLGEPLAVPRLSDLPAVAAGARGKLERSLEEDEEEDAIFEALAAEAVAAVFAEHARVADLAPVVEAFGPGRQLLVGDRLPSADCARALAELPALARAVSSLLARTVPDEEMRQAPAVQASALELLLEGLHRAGKLSKKRLAEGSAFGR